MNFQALQQDAREHGEGAGHGYYDAATARAFADLADTLPLAAELLRRGGVLRTFKGRKLADEIAAIPPEVRAQFAPEIVQRPYEVPGTSVAGVLVQFERI